MGPTYELYMDEFDKANMFARKLYNYFPELPGISSLYSIPDKKEWNYNNVPMKVVSEGITYLIYRREELKNE